MVKFIKYILILSLSVLVSGTLRCGVDETFERNKRFVLNDRPHDSMTISYKISQYTNQLEQQDVDNVIQKAFNMWSEHTDLKFIKNEPKAEADINIRFAAGDHGDGFPFDGPGNVLAHALKNYVHFDDDETWKATPEAEGTSLFKVAVHEIGHSLGLGHSHEKDSIMFFAHSGDNENEFKLHEDDIKGIQEIYGGKINRPAFSTDLCKDPTFDTMFDTPDGQLYIFKKDNYYEIEGTAITGGPQLISTKWAGLPGDINGAFSKNGKTFFFKGEDYWRFTGDKMDDDYPQRLSRWYSEVPNSIDDVTVWNDGKIYFFKSNKFYRMDDFKEEYTTVYVNEIAKEWKGIPNKVDAVHYNPHWHLTFFFKVDKFYAFESERDAYEIPTNSYFFTCSNSN